MTGERTYRIETLGCKANLYDSRRLAEALDALGYRRAAEDESPDVCLVNTCTVTHTADRKSRQQAARLAREHPDARVFVTGCYASAFPDELEDVEGVAGVFGRDQWRQLLAAVHGWPPPTEAVPVGDFGIGSFGGRSRAFLKVQEGCNVGCSYCILPRVRGRPRSQPLRQAVAEARRLVDRGFAEIVLTGIHLGWYGTDLPGPKALAELVAAVAEVPGLQRLRLSSLQPAEVGESLLEAMDPPVVCPHLHLPLQSGDAEVLRRMRRPYTPDQFLRAVEMARERLERPAVTTDVMVGFPGETEEAFGHTVDICRRARFSRMHVFAFSARPGTRAARMEDEVPPQVASERSERLRALGKDLAVEWAESFVGRRVRVLFERCRGGRLSGYTDRYVRLTCPGPADLIDTTAQVECTARNGTSLTGRLPPEPAEGASPAP
jgi:threonylcarbamoyladenosine tRNA methylthiotransferase MtaB